MGKPASEGSAGDGLGCFRFAKADYPGVTPVLLLGVRGVERIRQPDIDRRIQECEALRRHSNNFEDGISQYDFPADRVLAAPEKVGPETVRNYGDPIGRSEVIVGWLDQSASHRFYSQDAEKLAAYDLSHHAICSIFELVCKIHGRICRDCGVAGGQVMTHVLEFPIGPNPLLESGMAVGGVK